MATSVVGADVGRPSLLRSVLPRPPAAATTNPERPHSWPLPNLPLLWRRTSAAFPLGARIFRGHPSTNSGQALRRCSGRAGRSYNNLNPSQPALPHSPLLWGRTSAALPFLLGTSAATPSTLLRTGRPQLQQIRNHLVTSPSFALASIVGADAGRPPPPRSDLPRPSAAATTDPELSHNFVLFRTGLYCGGGRWPPSFPGSPLPRPSAAATTDPKRPHSWPFSVVISIVGADVGRPSPLRVGSSAVHQEPTLVFLKNVPAFGDLQDIMIVPLFPLRKEPLASGLAASHSSRRTYTIWLRSRAPIARIVWFGSYLMSSFVSNRMSPPEETI